MDVLNKFYSTVSSTVSQLSGVLPGNPVTREYEVTNHIASAGPGLLWKVYSGYKKSTKQPASVFVCDKKQIVPQDKEIVFETLRRGVAQLTKLRHPQILVVQHPLEESRDCLAFATEPVFLSLANILGQQYNMPPNCEHVSLYKLYDVEIKYGILQIAEGLAFLHRDAKILHGNLCPASVVVNQQGAWKIFGFDFAAQSTSTGATPSWQYVDYRKHGNEFAHPDLDYLAPECGLTESHGPPSDMYSLGVLIFTIYNGGETLFNIKSWRTYTTAMSKLKALQVNRLQKIPAELKDLVRMMLNTTPELRPDEHEFLKASYFEDVGVKALNYLDSLFQWDNRQKSHFYKGLPQIIDKLPHRVCLFRVIPCLIKEYVNPMMVPFVLPNVFAIAENCSKHEFNTHIFPSLRTVMAMNEPIQILLTFMQRMDLLLKMAHSEDIKSDVLPLLYRALESDSQDIQELCLSVLPTFANLIDSPSMKNALLPRIKRLCISTSSISVRVNCLVCIGKLVDHLDKWLVLDEVLPFLPQIPSKEPAVLMGILGIYKLVLTHKKMNMSKELMASKVVPFLMPLSIENSLTLNQFNTLITVIKDMVNRVEVEQRAKLEQLQSIQQEHKSLETSLVASNLGVPTKSMPTTSDLEELFGMSSPKLPDTPEKSSQSLEKLTLQDKQRIMAEGDAARRLSSSQVLTPSAATSTKANSQIKDLTASLLGSGGSGFSLGDGKIKTLPETKTQMGGSITKLDGPASSLMSVNGSIGSSSMMAAIKPMTNNAMISGSPMMSGNPMMSGMSTSAILPGNTMMANSPLVGSNMVKGNATQGWSGQPGNDWSSSPQWGKMQPVAQLNGNGVAPGWGAWAKPALQPPLLGNSAPSQPSAKPLSKSEINDLLS